VKHVNPTNEQRERAALYALGALPAGEARAFETHLRAGCSACRREVDAFRAVTGNLALAATPVAPRPQVRARALAAARAVDAQVERGELRPAEGAGFAFALETGGVWDEVEPLIFRRALAGAPGSGSAAYLIRMAPGATAATHVHAAVEHCYVLEGDLHVAGRCIRTGDYHRAAPGSRHEGLRSDGGCLLLIVEAHP
jgi:anti-sigma factor ChrR (cupin superfamily)